MSGTNRQNDRRTDSERRTYKRDTILMICALVVLFLSPIGISIYSNYQEQKMMEEYAQQIEESLASASDATSSDAESMEETEADAETGQVSETDAEDPDRES